MTTDRAAAAIVAAIRDPGRYPGHHRRIMARHREQWPVLWRALDQLVAEQGMTEPGSVTCPVCERTSYHPDDVRYGYCGACHESTSPPRIEEGSEP